MGGELLRAVSVHVVYLMRINPGLQPRAVCTLFGASPGNGLQRCTALATAVCAAACSAGHSTHAPVHNPLLPVCQAADEVQGQGALANAQCAGDHHAEATLAGACGLLINLQHQVEDASVALPHHDTVAEKTWQTPAWQLYWHHDEVVIWVSCQHSHGERQQPCKSTVAAAVKPPV